MPSHRPVTLLFALATAACAGPRLAVDADATQVEGTFIAEEASIDFRAESKDQQRTALHLDIDGVRLDIDVDLVAMRLVEDGHGDSLYANHLAALVALRDTLIAERPDLRETMQGSLLIRVIDRFAEAPIGLVLDRHAVDLGARSQQILPGCGDDSISCLPGTSGTTWAVYDAGSTGQCIWVQTTYGGSSCPGRCGAGCNWFDNDYTWDCLDHDRCLDGFGGSSGSGNVNCGDEFWDAADDYIVTTLPYCWSGSHRTPPT